MRLTEVKRREEGCCGLGEEGGWRWGLGWKGKEGKIEGERNGMGRERGQRRTIGEKVNESRGRQHAKEKEIEWERGGTGIEKGERRAVLKR